VDSGNTGRSENVCSEIIALHSDYLDGLLASHEAAQVQWHLSSCAGCARYDRVVRRGVEMVRELPEITPSEDFEARLQHRIYHLQDGAAIGSQRTAGVAATFAVASMIALLAWSPVFLGSDEQTESRVAAERPGAERNVQLTTPLLGGSEDLWFPLPAAEPLRSSDLIATLAWFPGPYSPLIVMPPVHGGAVRAVSAEYAPID
jgi:hypothetical protein